MPSPSFSPELRHDWSLDEVMALFDQRSKLKAALEAHGVMEPRS